MWDVPDDVIRGTPCSTRHHVPTARHPFEPQLIEGMSHPAAPRPRRAQHRLLTATMAVHSLGAGGANEARILMLSTNNILKPSDGRPVAMPSQDMDWLVCSHLTRTP